MFQAIATTLVVLTTFLSYSNGALVNLDSTNFHSIVDGHTNVFVNFYAPWYVTTFLQYYSPHFVYLVRCGHCKALAPHYALLGDTYLEEDDIIIAHIDATENPDITREFLVSGFPTILFFPKGSNNPFPYEEDKTLEAMTEWINNRLGVERYVPLPQSHALDLDKTNFASFLNDGSQDAVVLFYSRGICPSGNCMVTPLCWILYSLMNL